MEKYAGLIRHYRERWAAYGHDPAGAVVGAGFGRYQEAFGHELSGVSLEVPGLADAENRASVETFVTDVLPVLRATYPGRVWN